MKRLYILLLPALFACTETVESSDIRTTGIYPEFAAIADGSGSTEVSARFKVGGNDSNTFLDIQGGDRIEMTSEGETRTLS